jgi:hypothetical protein
MAVKNAVAPRRKFSAMAQASIALLPLAAIAATAALFSLGGHEAVSMSRASRGRRAVFKYAL